MQTSPMDEASYWEHLEFRVCAELAGIEECRRRGLWCDGFIPGQFDLKGDPPCIRGTAWVCPGEQQEAWDFTLLLGKPRANRDAIPWAALLPPDGVTKWLRLDFAKRQIEIDPGGAVRDGSGQTR